MIIPLTFPPSASPSTSTSTSSSSAPALPPVLAQISHAELVLIELQGALEVECTTPRARDGRLVGRLWVGDGGQGGKPPTLTIGHHLLEGRLALLPKPLAVLRRVPVSSSSSPGTIGADPDAMAVDGDASQRREETETGEEDSEVAWTALAIVKRKIVFSKRPMPVVGKGLNEDP
ncbi:hypothetical protein B0H11DRAFT_2040451 [Mycena galericulata]|nr:hypothetical protein B0H11DRAFT_2040451 [Mycena galericulata]